MISITILGLGVISWFRIPLNFLPKIDEPFIGCSIPYPGASPEQVEQQIAIPAEGEFRTIPGLRQIRTISDSDGCFISMLFNLDTEMTFATAEVRTRMERLKLVLPDDADRMILQRFSSQSIPVTAIGLFRGGDQEAFVNTLRTVLEPRLRRVEGVADVQVRSPVREREVLIEFEQDNLRSLGLGLADVVAQLRASSLNLSVGELRDGDTKFLVRAVGEYRRIDDIANLLVGPAGLRLREAATVRYSTRDEQAFVSFNGEGGALIFVTKESEANTVATCRAVREELDRILSESAFDSVNHLVFFDQAELITSALDNLFQEGIYGAVMALIVLFAFLHRFRPTLIVALTIPTSLLIALVFMFFAGMSMNLITMVSMIISVGMLVDNSIVVVENIIRHRELGLDPEESAKRGATEVGLAILAATTTTWVVFVPMYYLETGQMAIFMEQLGLPLVISLGGSLLIALTLIPLAMSRMRSSERTNYLGLVLRLFRRKAVQGSGPNYGLDAIQWIVSFYTYALRVALRWRTASALILAGLVAVTILIPVQRVGSRDMPKLDTREVRIDLEFDQNFDSEMARQLVSFLEGHLDQYREELGIKNVLSIVMGPDNGFLEAYLYTDEDGDEWKNPKYDTEEVMNILAARIGKQVPGAELSFSLTEEGESGKEQGLSLQVRGDDARLLEGYADQFALIMGRIEGLREATTDVQQARQEMRIKIDEVLARKAGIPPIVIAQTVDAALRGARLPEMKQGTREIPVWAQFREEDRKSRENLDNVAVLSPVTRELLSINQLVDLARGQSPSSIHRVNAKNVVTLHARAETENLSRIIGELQVEMDKFELPAGYSIQLGDELVQLDDNMVSFTASLLMAVVLIYIVMSSLFESYLLPLSILSSVPLALGGAMWMLYFTSSSLDSVTLIGCILMAGVIVNNGIVIVDHINNLRRGGADAMTAIIDGGRDRFRPVMMTALTTILGLLPLAMAKTGGAATFAGLGRALIGGLTAGTILTLFVVPLFFSLIDDLQRWFSNYLGNLRALRSGPRTR